MRICFIGDSLVAGTGDPDYLGWPGRIAIAARRRGHDITCYNLGVRGHTAAQILARWRAEAAARYVETDDCRLVFEFGINDTKETDGRLIVAPETAGLEAQEILAGAVAWQKTLMIGPPPVSDAPRNARVAAMSARIGAVCAGLNVPFLDSFAALSAEPAWAQAVARGDGVHPVAAGYDVWAQAIEAWPAWRVWTP